MGEITVTDTGEGITEEFLPFVFDRFQQADASITRKHGGLGLGLAITRHLVEMHGGTIEVQSKGKDHGSTFRLRLPLAPLEVTKESTDRLEKATVYEEISKSTAAPKLSGVRVLAIDDAYDTRDLLRTVLEQYGADVATASSSLQGFEVLMGWKPDVIVCDIGMPEEDGYSFIKRVRKLEPQRGGRTPAVALTGYVRVEDRMRALEAGYQMFVPKPVEASELGTAIETLAGRSE